MNPSEINVLVEKLAEKLNVAADKLKPLANEVLNQFVNGQIFRLLWNCLFLIIPFIAAYYTCKKLVPKAVAYGKDYKDAEKEVLCWTAVIGILFSCVICLILSIIEIRASTTCIIAPLPSILDL